MFAPTPERFFTKDPTILLRIGMGISRGRLEEGGRRRTSRIGDKINGSRRRAPLDKEIDYKSLYLHKIHKQAPRILFPVVFLTSVIFPGVFLSTTGWGVFRRPKSIFHGLSFPFASRTRRKRRRAREIVLWFHRSIFHRKPPERILGTPSREVVFEIARIRPSRRM